MLGPVMTNFTRREWENTGSARGYAVVSTGWLVVQTVFHFGRTFHLLSMRTFTYVQQQSADLGT